MRLLMGISKNRHGTYYAIKQVPKHLQAAVARVLNNGKARQSWLKRSLGTKDTVQANRLAKPVLIEFDRTLERAKALLVARPIRTGLSPVEIKRMVEYYYANKLVSHDEFVRDASEIEAETRRLEPDAGPWDTDPIPEFGLSGGQQFDFADNMPTIMKEAEAALGKGDILHIEIQLDELLETLQINLDRKSVAYRQLGLEVLRAHVRALRAIQHSFAGEPIEIPPVPALNTTPAAEPGRTTLPSAFDGWKRARNRSPRTVQEYDYAIKLFGELHGDMPLAAIRKTQARQFRQALQDVPTKPFRTGKMLRATLPELTGWGREHPDAQKIGAATINKLLGALQSIGRWARKEDLVPEEWADPFADMRLDEDESTRAPFELRELQAIFTAAVFTKGERPKGGQGEAAFWLPLLALFGGERLSELTGLRVSDVAHNELIGAVAINISEDRKAGRRLKTKQSERFIPVHPQLIELGFLDFVTAQAKARGAHAWLFPLVAPGTKGTAAYSKWFGRYIGAHGVTDTAKVFHSFRHSHIDALRVANIGDEIKHALLGWSGGGIPAKYGAKDKAARFRHRLAEAVGGVSYTGLDLSSVAYGRTP
jgi:integrase